MTTSKQSLALAFALAASAGAVAATPNALAGVSGGLWELDGLPGTKSSVRQCFADPARIALVEHKGAKCTEAVLGEQGSTVRVSYQCGASGFGQGTIKQITPRSLRVEVTGIADGAPYSYVLQARRVDDCAKGQERGR
ncbi:MAG: hypothetical protein ABIO29_08405 [Sphingomicrobium sp.]